MESVAFSQLDCLSLVKRLNINSNHIILLGGGSKSPTWRQIISDVLNHKLVTLNVEEGPAFGAALIADVGCSMYHGIEEVIDGIIKIDKEINPIEKNVKKYKQIYTVYKSLYSDLKDSFKEISSLQQ